MTKNDVANFNNNMSEKIEDLLWLMNRDKPWRIYCGNPEDQTKITITDWNREYMGIRDGHPYLFIWGMKDNCLLYVIDVEGTSTKQALADLFELIAKKF